MNKKVHMLLSNLTYSLGARADQIYFNTKIHSQRIDKISFGFEKSGN